MGGPITTQIEIPFFSLQKFDLRAPLIHTRHLTLVIFGTFRIITIITQLISEAAAATSSSVRWQTIARFKILKWAQKKILQTK